MCKKNVSVVQKKKKKYRFVGITENILFPNIDIGAYSLATGEPHCILMSHTPRVKINSSLEPWSSNRFCLDPCSSTEKEKKKQPVKH